ncbi:MAG: hypothetical protein IPK95_10140 [Cellvibrionales bacterium]|nr:hypothetical protein [Cellvibrionales bacterium]
MVITTIESKSSQAASLIQQKDGKLLAAGSSYDGSKYRFTLMRYKTDGKLDASFGKDGIVITTRTGNDADSSVITSVIQQSDGKLVAAGYRIDEPNTNILIARYNISGSLDRGFSDDGVIRGDISTGHQYANSIIQQTDGRLVVAGYSKIQMAQNPIFS